MDETKPTKKYTRLKSSYSISSVAEVDLRLKSFREQIKSDDFSPIKTMFYDLSQHSQIMLLVLNDVHIGSPGCNIDKVIRYLKEVKNIPNCYIILNGDLMNNANNLGKSSPLENALPPMNEQKIIHTLLADPLIREKIICSTSGNHESGARARDSGLDSLVTPMASLGILDKYARYMAQVVLRIKCPYTASGYTDFKILVRHGSGMGGKAGKIIEEMFNLCRSFGNYDMVIQGHTHKNLYATDDQVVQGEKYSCIKKSVTPINIPALEEASQYAMEAAYPPPNTDNSIICVRAVRNYDALDSALNEGYEVLPYKFNIDTISLDRPELVHFASQSIEPPRVISRQELEVIAERVARQVTLKTKRPKAPKTTPEPNDDGREE
ncbi:MAG: metallophosphoesterase [Clostridia bacterium]|nr:metallophosphoesterase [Clostridia bacterium]